MIARLPLRVSSAFLPRALLLLPQSTITLPALASLFLLLHTPGPAAAEEPREAITWSPFSGSVFERANESDRRVFLLLTAPWNWDHFLLPRRLLAEPEIVERANELYVPVRADATIFPELRELYRISSGLVPSVHFVDPDGRPLASFPPLGREELAFYLDDLSAADDPRPRISRAEIDPLEISREHLTNRLARMLLSRFERRESDVALPHRDLDLSSLTFLLEYAATRPWRRDVQNVVMVEVRSLLESNLYDDADGGFHRAFATSDRSVVHLEKTLRINAEAVGLLASWYRMTGDTGVGARALLTMRFLNDRLRVHHTTLYAGSLAADLYVSEGGELLLKGPNYYRMNAATRRRTGAPPVSSDVPVGANFVLHQSMRDCYRAFLDERMQQATWRAGAQLLEEAFHADGTARRTLGAPGVGNLRDQADAGSGLIAYHGLSGSPEALVAARALARALEAQFENEKGVFSNVSERDDLPPAVFDLAPLAPWNGAVLRFLAELAAVTGEERWKELATRGLDRWAARVPENARGVGELGRAALRVDAEVPVLVVAADPSDERGQELMLLAHRLFDPLALVRWIDPGDRSAAQRFGVELDGDAAVYLVWDTTSPAIRDDVTLRAAFDDAVERVRAP